MADFNNINNVVMNDPENIGNPNMEIVMCPICEDRMARNELSSHLDGCNGITGIQHRLIIKFKSVHFVMINSCVNFFC